MGGWRNERQDNDNCSQQLRQARLFRALQKPDILVRIRRGGGATMKLLLAVLAFACSALAQAQAFPNRPVNIVVPYPPGGLIDLVARALQPFLQTQLGVPVVAENHAGAGGNVGAEVVSRAAPDGYTLLLANPSLAISPTLYKKLNYRPIEDFAYVGRYGSVANVMVANPAMPFKTAQELIAYAKK